MEIVWIKREGMIYFSIPLYRELAPPVGYNEFDFFLENKEYRPFDGCKIEI
jgi:hypothetical protein